MEDPPAEPQPVQPSDMQVADREAKAIIETVSYTHLPLPTKRIV